MRRKGRSVEKKKEKCKNNRTEDQRREGKKQIEKKTSNKCERRSEEKRRKEEKRREKKKYMARDVPSASQMQLNHRFEKEKPAHDVLNSCISFKFAVP